VKHDRDLIGFCLAGEVLTIDRLIICVELLKVTKELQNDNLH